MTNEKPWWWSVWLSRLWGGETDSDPTNYRAIASIVAEAERRGEMKAWEEVSLVLKDVKQEFRCAACDGASNLSHTHTCSAFAKIEAKLTSLKTP